jgi:hypothetical protein
VIRQPIPLAERRLDLAFIGFFLVNLLFISYIVDLEQVLIADVARFTYPLWPPARLVDLVHWYGRTFDPLMIARPPFWKATAWLDVLFFGPYYAAAIYAFWKGRDWIRVPTIIYATMLFTNVVLIMSEEAWGVNATPRLAIVAALNFPWFLVPVALIARMWRSEHPFTREPSPARWGAG